MLKKKIQNNLKKYHFELRHISVILFILILFQIIFSLVQKSSLENFLKKNQNWYKKESAERISNLSTTSLELMMEYIHVNDQILEESKSKIIESFNIIFSQQLLEQDVELSCLIVFYNDKPLVIDDGKVFYKYLNGQIHEPLIIENKYKEAVKLFLENINVLQNQEQIFSIQKPKETFHVLVPLVPRGEFLGVLYMKNTPNFSFITRDILSGYNQVAIIYSVLILLGLIAMFLISSYSVNQRDQAQKLLFEEHETHLKEKIMYEKESLFTKRIYHTHHKAEKVMGFIKEDLRKLEQKNIKTIKEKLYKYANFVSRVIYDMKWYDPPIQTIRNQIFKTNINEIIKFIIDNLFLRISTQTKAFKFNLELDENLPVVEINEYVIWEILEPLIQNSIDHGSVENLLITISTFYNKQNGETTITIRDNGVGIKEELLTEDENGIKKIFMENVSTKPYENQNKGYGCYIAYEMATKKCKWKLDVKNLTSGGCQFKLTFKNKTING